MISIEKIDTTSKGQVNEFVNFPFLLIENRSFEVVSNLNSINDLDTPGIAIVSKDISF